MRVVIDTSTTFSALAFNGVPARVLEALQASDEWEIAISVEMRDELQRKLSEKGRDSTPVVQALRRYFALCVLVEPLENVQICRDPNDDFILACAIEAGAKLIVSSDEDLLVLSTDPRIGGIEIISVSEARQRFLVGMGMSRA